MPRLPVASTIANRTTALTKDAKRENCLFEKLPEGDLAVVKRPGITKQFVSQTGTLRGSYYWNGEILSVWGTELYRGLTLIGTVAGTDRVYFEEIGGATNYLAVADKANAYQLTTAWVLTAITDADFTAFTGRVNGPVMMDGYLFWMNQQGQILHSDVNDMMNYNPLNVLTAEAYPDRGVFLTRQLNYVVAFGERSIEFFYDAANATGSVLRRVPGQLSAIGCVGDQTIAKEGDYVFFAGHHAGGRSAYVLENGRPRPISTPYIDRLLGSSTFAGVRAYVIRIHGHLIYGLMLPDLNITLWYDAIYDDWSLATDTAGNYWPYWGASSSPDGQCYMVGPSGVYKVTGNSDDGSAFNMKIVTNALSFGTMERKVIERFEIEADKGTGTFQLRYSDDDFATFSTARILPAQRPTAVNLGMFKRRAFEIVHAAGEPMRIYAVDIDIIKLKG